jgi:hypothetical protein
LDISVRACIDMCFGFVDRFAHILFCFLVKRCGMIAGMLFD